MIHATVSFLTATMIRRQHVLICLMLCSALTGCSAYPLGFARKKPPQCFPPMHGVDDPVFHGHRRTCWKNWDDAGWSEIPCPEYNGPPRVPMVPMVPMAVEQPIRQAPPAEETLPMEMESESAPFERPSEPMLLPPMDPPEIPFPGE